MEACVPIHAILCDGTTFDFFYFDGTIEPFSFKRGLDPNISLAYPWALQLPDLSYLPTSPFINALRPICETIFNLLLHGYVSSLKSLHNYIVTKNAREDQSRRSAKEEESEKAINAAIKAWQGFKDAEMKRQTQLTNEANSTVEEAMAALKCRYGIPIFSCGNISKFNEVLMQFQCLTNQILTWSWVVGMMLRLKKYDFSQIL